MKNKMTSQASKKLSEEPLWKFGATTWLLVVGIVLLNIGCFSKLSILDMFFGGIFNLFDFRTWAWWYFVIIVAVFVCSIRWYLLYQKYIDDDFDPTSSEEAKCFCLLSGILTLLVVIFVFLHRFSLLQYFYQPLYSWFGFGIVTFAAFLILILLLAIVGLVVYWAWRWIDVLLEK
ncbi:MAG: hypothetical protein LBJ00_03465 [Planctomycetaceae bacterium]|jgi:hypothetical protein|nr:hypothetical protein [Planctomycetaceae bacterium]